MLHDRKAEASATIKEYILKGGALFQLQYHDYTVDQWTIPALLTEDRAEKFLNDLSVKTIKLIHEIETTYLVL